MTGSFINDVKTFILLIGSLIINILIIFLCFINEKIAIIPALCVFGGFFLLGLFCLTIGTEIIIIYDDKIVSKKGWKQKCIMYEYIVSIEETIDRGDYAGLVESGWKIKNSSEQYIFVVEFFGRKKYIDFIKQKANKLL